MAEWSIYVRWKVAELEAMGLVCPTLTEKKHMQGTIHDVAKELAVMLEGKEDQVASIEIINPYYCRRKDEG